MRKPSTQLLYLLLAFFVVLTPFLSAGCGGSGGSLLPGSQKPSSGLNLKLQLKQTDSLQTQSADIVKLVVKLSSSGYTSVEQTFAITRSSGTATIGNIPPAMGISLEVGAYCRQNTLKYTGSQKVDFIAGEITEVYLKLDPYSPSSLITDSNLRDVIKTKLSLGTNDTITSSHLAGMSELDAPSSEINVLTGLNYATNLESLNLKGNKITDVSPLETLTKLTSLNLVNNTINDISKLNDLEALNSLNLFNNSIEEIDALVNMTNLTWLNLGENPIDKIKSLANNSGLDANTTIEMMDTNVGKDDYLEIQTIRGRGTTLNINTYTSGFKVIEEFADGNYNQDPPWELKYTSNITTSAMVENEVLKIMTTNPLGGGYLQMRGGGYLVTGSSTWTDYWVQAEITMQNTQDSAGIVLAVDTQALDRFAVLYYSGSASMFLLEYVSSYGSDMAEVAPPTTISPNTPFTIKLVYDPSGETLVGYFGSSQTSFISLSSVPSLAGKAGIAVYHETSDASSTVWFDDIMIESK